MTSWGRELLRILEDGHRPSLSLRDFAKMVRAKPGHLSEMINGKPAYRDGPIRKPPLEKIDAWADALGLTGENRERFIELAELEHAPARIAKRYLTLKARVQLLAERIERLEKQ